MTGPRIDHEKISPFLLKVFVAPTHHDERDYSIDRLPPARDEHVIYTWRDTTLRDLIVQLLSSDQGSKLMTTNAARYSIRHVYLEEARGTYGSRDIGFVFARDLPRAPGELRGTPARTLADIRFVIGDFLDIALVSANGPPLGGGVGAFGNRIPSATGGRDSFGGDRRRSEGNWNRGVRKGSRSPSPRRDVNGPDAATWKRGGGE